ncbi:MAG: type III-B CRISPR module RAMP protein Cmr1 [Chloroflexota bacterium]|nr:type III-B CRISPR module RAMP protein Cmr1 [Chloroflexota bacterium]
MSQRTPDPNIEIPAVPTLEKVPDRLGWHTEERQYELITPLFGGGVAKHTADPVTVVRGASIRGQLRFWWRACRAGRYGDDLLRLKQAEDLLWGAASAKGKPYPARVQVRVVCTNPGRAAHPYEVGRGKVDARGVARPKLETRDEVAPAYAAFPLQPTELEMRQGGIGMPTAAVQTGVRFQLTLSFATDWPPDSVELFRNSEGSSQAGATPAEEVAAALWAWETFGGVGGRTRRGFGAVRRLNDSAALPSTASDAFSWLRRNLETHVLRGKGHPQVPHLAQKGVWQPTDPLPRPTDLIRFVVIQGGWRRPHDAWKYLIDRLRSFRQQRTKGVTGRSLWPEADSIRAATGYAAAAFQQAVVTTRKYPRAALGLPIVFHFKDQREGDPPDVTLQRNVQNHERLASPVIMRPLACADGTVVALVAALRTPSLTAEMVELSWSGQTRKVSPTVEAAEATALEPLHGQPDVVQAFLRTFK